jgi:hypothetical protein
MLRILPAFLALIATVTGWFTVPPSAMETGRDSSRISWIAQNPSGKLQVHHPGWDGSRRFLVVSANSPETVRPSPPHASFFPIPGGSPHYVAQILQNRFPELFSRPVDTPPAYRLGQCPPPHSV